MFDVALRLWLDRIEGQLRHILNEGDMPFLGLYAELFTDDYRQYLRKKLSVSPSKQFSGFIWGLQHYPVVFATYLTVHVVEGYGKDGNHAVYPFIEQAIFGAIRSLSNDQRDKLWRAYRNACTKIGLQVLSGSVGQNFMIQEYLNQAGVPLRYIASFTDRMVSYSRHVGLPDDDDPGAIQLWQAGLVEKLGPPVSVTIPHALHADDTSYYPRLFLRLIQDASHIGEDSPLIERAMADAIRHQSRSATEAARQTRLVIPKVVWRDETLAVELPEGKDTLWKVIVGDNVEEYRATVEPRLVPLNDPLPLNVTVRESGGRIERVFVLWGETKNNRFMLIDSDGLLVCDGQLGESQPVQVDPGSYTLLSRFMSGSVDSGCHQISENPAIYTCQIELSPGGQHVVQHGPAVVVFSGKNKPALHFYGEHTKGIYGNELYASKGLGIKVELPREIIESTDVDFFLHIDPVGLGEAVDIPVLVTGNETFTMDLEPYCLEWSPGVSRIVVEVSRTDTKRPLVRSSINLWNGLDAVEDRVRFHVSRDPQNLDESTSDNLRLDKEKGIISYRDDDKRYFRTIFDLPNSRTLSFTWTVPGVFLYLKDYATDPVTEVPISKGRVLGLRGDSREVLVIHSTKSGVLHMGEYRNYVDFTRIGSKRIPLSSLVDYLAPDADTLGFLADGLRTSESLVKLVAPHQVLNFHVNNASDICTAKFGLLNEAEEVRCNAVELLSGKDRIFSLICNDVAAVSNRDKLAWLSAHPIVGGQTYHELTCYLSQWDPGAWLLELEVKVNGRWGPLANKRQDSYALGFLNNKSSSHNDIKVLIGQVVGNRDNWLAIFKRAHRILLRSFALESWQTFPWLKEVWKIAAEQLSVEDRQVLLELASLVSERPPEISSPSWVPLLTIIARFPEVLARQAHEYAALGGRGKSITRILHDLAGIEAPLVRLFSDEFFDIASAAGFDNFRQIAAGGEPHMFKLGNYIQSLGARDLPERVRLIRDEDWKPAPGDYLGPLHYRFAMEKLRQSYEESLAGNEYRRGRSLLLSMKLARSKVSDYGNNFPVHLVVSPCLGFMQEEPEEGWTQEEENILGIIHFLCLFAGCCRWDVRSPGTLANFIDYISSLDNKSDTDINETFSYILFLGTEILGFYLLLWEFIFAADVDSNKDSTNG